MKLSLNIIKYRFVFLPIAALLVLASLGLIFSQGLKLGIDFTGGTLWRFSAEGGAERLSEIKEIFSKDLKAEGVVLTYSDSEKTFFARLPVIDEPTHQAGLGVLKSKLVGFEELSFESIGPSIGAELKGKAMQAIVLGLLGISLYVAFAFRRVSRPVSSWKYGLITLLTLFHDVVIAAGFLGLMGYLYGVEVDANFIVALLVIAGFSVHDTIVVFDRIREGLVTERGRMDFTSLVNASVNQTIARSINTSFTLILVLVALLLVGPQTLFYFIATLLVGTIAGTYSSIFVASPLLVAWEGKRLS